MTEIDLSWMGTTMLVWAHPDDETYLSGGTAAALVDAGQRVVAVTASRGEAGGRDLSPADRAETASVRTAELEEALRHLGVTQHVWLGYEDGGCASSEPEPAVRCLADLCDEVLPDTVVTFGPEGFTGHPDHKAVSGWVDLALARTIATPRLLHAVATLADRVDPGSTRTSVSSRWGNRASVSPTSWRYGWSSTAPRCAARWRRSRPRHRRPQA